MRYVVLILFFLVSCEKSVSTVSGVFTGAGSGRSGPILVDVSYERGVIVDIIVVQHNEHPEYAPPIFEQLIESVLVENSTDIDIISGATFTSRGFLEAVNDSEYSALSSEKAVE